MTHEREKLSTLTRYQREFWKITYIVNGSGRMLLDDEPYPIEAGSLLVVHPNALTMFELDTPALEIYNLLFLPSLFEGELMGLKDDFDYFAIFAESFRQETACAPLYILKCDAQMESIFRSMEREFEGELPNYRVFVKAKLLELLVLLLRRSDRARRRLGRAQVAAYVDHYLEAHFKEDVDLDSIASRLGLAKSHLCRVYKSERGATVIGALIDLRLSFAAGLLRSSRCGVAEACYASGFNDLSYFYRAFKRKFGLRPGSCLKKSE
jgi:AraC-like DNA-binding protein